MLSRGVERKKKKKTSLRGRDVDILRRKKRKLSREFALLWLSASIEPVFICFF